MKTPTFFAAAVACFLVLTGGASLQGQSFPPALNVGGTGIFQQTFTSGNSASYGGSTSDTINFVSYSITLSYSWSGSTLSYSVSMDVAYYNGDTGVSSNNHYDGSYNPATNVFDVPGSSLSPVNSDGVPWVPPPSYASFGPPRIWVNGTTYSWSDSSFVDSDFTHGTDNYTCDGSHWVYVTYSGDPPYTVSGTTLDGTAINGNYTQVSST